MITQEASQFLRHCSYCLALVLFYVSKLCETKCNFIGHQAEINKYDTIGTLNRTDA